MEVSFSALIKSITTKSLRSLDKGSQMVLEFQPDDELLDKINRLHKADSLVKITIQEESENG